MPVAETPEEFRKLGPTDSAAALLYSLNPPAVSERAVPLAELTEKALRILSGDPDGFFLMVEGSQIDWAGHKNDKDWLIEELIDFDDAVGVVMDFAETHPDTLVVVTADHETGGFAINNGSLEQRRIDDARFTKDYHTAAMVPVLASGPGAEAFGGIIDITAVGQALIRCVNGRSVSNTGASYEKCIIVHKPDAKQFEVMAAKNLAEFFEPVLPVSVVSGTGGVTGSNDRTLVVCVGDLDTPDTDAALSGISGEGYVINDTGRSLVIAGTDADLTYLAASRFIHDCMQNRADGVLSGKTEALDIACNFPERDEYIHDIDRFVSLWEYEWQPPDWLLDFDEKIESFYNTESGRAMSRAHRGGMGYYPENSIEAIISSIQMGVDAMELDVRKTLDGVMVLSHDFRLHETTDWLDKKGKNGLPEDNDLTKWTYDQLRQLRLRFNGENYADETGEVSRYIIPTLEEVFDVCDERAFVTIDKLKPAEHWDEVYALIKKTKAYRCFAFSDGFSLELAAEKQALMLKECGATTPYYSLRERTGNLPGECECETVDEVNALFESFVDMGPVTVMINHVKEMVECIDRRYASK